MHDDSDLHEVLIRACGNRTEIQVDGAPADPRAVVAYTVSQRCSVPPQIVLYLSENTETVLDGLAHVAVADPPDPGPAAAAFLEATTLKSWSVPHLPAQTSVLVRTR